MHTTTEGARPSYSSEERMDTTTGQQKESEVDEQQLAKDVDDIIFNEDEIMNKDDKIKELKAQSAEDRKKFNNTVASLQLELKEAKESRNCNKTKADRYFGLLKNSLIWT